MDTFCVCGCTEDIRLADSDKTESWIAAKQQAGRTRQRFTDAGCREATMAVYAGRDDLQQPLKAVVIKHDILDYPTNCLSLRRELLAADTVRIAMVENHPAINLLTLNCLRDGIAVQFRTDKESV